MALSLKFSNSLTSLAEILAARERVGMDPFEPEYIVVASTGLRRWLTQEIASRRGILGNCSFPTPRNFIKLLLKESLGKEESAAFSREAMTWRLYDLLKDSEDEPELVIPVGYLQNNPENRDLATLQLSEKTADLFDQYLTYRPHWIHRWERDQKIPTRNADSTRIRNHEQWQSHLWKKLVDVKGDHRARLYEELLDKLKAGNVERLPRHISIFGTHTLPPVFLEILKGLGHHHEVTLYLVQPTPEFWGDHPLRTLSSRKSRFLTETCLEGQDENWGNPLIAAMGGQGRDLFNILIDADIATSEEDDLALFKEPAEKTILGALQRSIYRIEKKVEGITENLVADDSLRIHCCHHPLREVEVLRDTLIKFFAEDPLLHPNDILVLAPDIEEYAPFIDSVFGQPEDGLPGIPYSVADRRFRSESQIVDNLFRIIELCRSRFTVTDMFALFQGPVFRERFAWDDDDLSTIRIWLSETRTSWGMDGKHRSAFGVPAIKDYTWQDTFDKIFLGYALPRQREQDLKIANCYDQIEGQDSVLVGKLAEAFELLRQAADEMAGTKTPAEWAEVIEARIVRPFLDTNKDEALEVRQIRHGLSILSDSSAGVKSRIELSALKTFLEKAIEDRTSAYGFLSKGITFGSLTPMRSIPTKVICLLGMKNGAFPRDPYPLGFDLMKIRGMSRQGDRAANQSGRYLFLETILSAKQKLHISYCGYTPRDDSVSPSATPVSELLDLLQSTWPVTGNKAPADLLAGFRFVVSHKLNGHHPGYYDESNPLLTAYSKSNYESAKVSFEEKIFPLQQPLQNAWTGNAITIDELVSFYINPARYFYSKQIQASLPYEERALLQDEPLELNQLDAYYITESRILAKLGWPVQRATPTLPPGDYGEWCRESIESEADLLFKDFLEAFGQEDLDKPAVHEIDLAVKVLDRTIQLCAVIPQIYGETHLRFRPASLKPKDEITAWIHHLVLNAAGYPITTKVAYTESRSGRTRLKLLQFNPAGQSTEEMLAVLVRLYIEGQTSPLPWILNCSMNYAAEWIKSEDELRALNMAQAAWDSIYSYTIDPWTLLCWGHRPPFLKPNREHFAEVAKEVALPIMENRS